MGLNQRCPKCGSDHVQISDIQKKHGCFWYLIFGWWFIIWRIVKMFIGVFVFFCFDWWLAIIAKVRNKGYVWKSRRWFSGRTKTYYCHECHHNFKG